MTLKEKLELLWKYLLLVVLVYGFTQLGGSHKVRMMNRGMGGDAEHGMMWFGGDDSDCGEMNVDVEIENLLDGDSTVKVIVNGQAIDVKDFERMGENVFIKKMKHSGEHKEKRIKVITKKMIDDD